MGQHAPCPDRATWEVLKMIDSAIFVMCLDDHGVDSVADATRTFLHGDGGNR